MFLGIGLILLGFIFLFNGQFWKYDYKTDSRIPDKIRFFFAGLGGIILGVMILIDHW